VPSATVHVHGGRSGSLPGSLPTRLAPRGLTRVGHWGQLNSAVRLTLGTIGLCSGVGHLHRHAGIWPCGATGRLSSLKPRWQPHTTTRPTRTSSSASIVGHGKGPQRHHQLQGTRPSRTLRSRLGTKILPTLKSARRHKNTTMYIRTDRRAGLTPIGTPWCGK
jgi:hypothetical protein